MITVNEIQGTEREFLDIFKTLCYSRNSWQVWGDLIEAFACSLANCVDKNTSYYTERENRYAKCIERLGSVEVPAKLFAVVVMAIEKNPKQDFLGKMFMELNLGNNWKGQFFTPYSVCEMMAGCTIGNVDAEISEKGFISICDPACGAGATLIESPHRCVIYSFRFWDVPDMYVWPIRLRTLSLVRYSFQMKVMVRSSGTHQCFLTRCGIPEGCSNFFQDVMQQKKKM